MPEFNVVWGEDSDVTVLGRVVARNGSGAAVTDEGNLLQQADVSSISYKTFDLDSDTPTAAIESGALTVASVILDAAVTGEIWTQDATGYNFIHDVPASWFPTGGHRYAIEYKFTLSGGAVFHGSYLGPARPIRSS